LEFEFSKCAACGIILCDECFGQHIDMCDLSVEELLG
jgi:hypothetical protein